MPDPDELTIEQRDAMLDRVASAVSRRRMETPAILFLEMNKPLSFLAGQGLRVASPFLVPFVGFSGFDNAQAVSLLLEDRENIERLIQRIETKASLRTEGTDQPETQK